MFINKLSGKKMDIAYFNGTYMPRDEIRISPDDRGFLFAEGIYEVVRWYQGFFFDMDGHLARMKRSLKETFITWPDEDKFPAIAHDLIRLNHLENLQSLVYLQVTRGAAIRSHAFPIPPVNPTVYAFGIEITPENTGRESGVAITVREDIRWARCDIKSTALLPNTLGFQDAVSKGFSECAFVRNGMITECSHSNIFLVQKGIVHTHPESESILSGITRKNIIRLARRERIPLKEEAVALRRLSGVQEIFITNTSGEITPVVRVDNFVIGGGIPGPVTRILRERFNDQICSYKHS